MGDLCRAVVLALESDIGGEVYQIATGIETSITELVEIIQEVSSSEAVINSSPRRVL